MVRRQAEFRVLHPVTGAVLAHYYDPATPWWLTLAGVDNELLYLDEPDTARLGQVAARRAIELTTGAVRWRRLLPDDDPAFALPPAPAVRVPAVYTAESAHFAALARFVTTQAGTAPATRIEYLETASLLVFAYDRIGVELVEIELLICAAADGQPLLRQPLGAALVGPEAGVFCIFGPTLYALGAGGTVRAWTVH